MERNMALDLLKFGRKPGEEAPADRLGMDITARRPPERKTAPQEGWQRLILGSTSDLISSHAPDGVYVFVSGACRRLLGWEPEEMLGRSVLDFVHPDDQEQALAAFQALWGGVERLNVTYRLRSRDGRHVWTEVTLSPLGGGPEPGYCVAVTRDVTAHKEAEERQARLRQALERAALEWRSTFDVIETPILLLNKDGRVQKVNRAAREMLGGEFRELVGRPIQELGAGPPWGAVAALATRALELSSPQVCEATDEKGARTWEVEATISSLREDDNLKVILQIRDITKTVRLQESLRRSETMAALGAVVGGVAHEVRNPLFGMSAVLDAFESRFGGRSEHQPYLPLLRTELHRMTELMQALLDYGKPGRFEMAVGDLAHSLDRALDLCRQLAERQEVLLTVEPSAGRMLLHDAGRMTQAFKNVLENAIQHSPAGGEIRVEGSEVLVEEVPWFRISVRDQGPGIPTADLSRVTEPFFSRRQGGTGLGLSIVSRVVEEHGGRLRFSNHPEGGAMVDIEFPCSRPMEGK
jgi:PAS domain S-box-containing protein